MYGSSGSPSMRTKGHAIQQRSSASVDALEAENVAADDAELWLEPKNGSGLPVQKPPHLSGRKEQASHRRRGDRGRFALLCERAEV